VIAIRTRRRQGARAMPQQLEVTVERESKAVVSRVDRDRALVEALRREPSAADDLLATYGDRACRLATRITGNPQDAEEAVQDAFWCVIRRIDTFRGESTFGSWLYRIVANAAYQKLRRRAARRRELSLDEMLPAFDHRGKHVEPVPDWSASVDDPARQTELRAALSAAIEELPPDYRAVVVLRDVEGLAHCEIGDALGLTVGNVKTRVHRARLFLRQRLERHLSPSRAEAL
jgi:RNA polymerase sigma-70 factor, ECF subfamily